MEKHKEDVAMVEEEQLYALIYEVAYFVEESGFVLGARFMMRFIYELLKVEWFRSGVRKEDMERFYLADNLYGIISTPNDDDFQQCVFIGNNIDKKQLDVTNTFGNVLKLKNLLLLW